MVFTCNYCSTHFSEKKNLTRHIKSKHEVTNLKCEKCEFTTTRKDHLKNHIESQHYQNKVKCPECTAEFSRQDNLERHRKDQHPQDPLALTPNFNWAKEVERGGRKPGRSTKREVSIQETTCGEEMVYQRGKGYFKSLHGLQRRSKNFSNKSSQKKPAENQYCYQGKNVKTR